MRGVNSAEFMRLLRKLIERQGYLLTILPNDALRRQMGIRRPKLNDATDLLAHPDRPQNMAHLARSRIEDLCDSTEIIQNEVVPQTLHLDGREAFEQTRVNPLHLGRPTIWRHLELYRFKNVFLVHKNNRFCLFDGDRIDVRSSALPAVSALKKRDGGNYTVLPSAAFCGDHWLPDNPAHFVSDQLSRALIFRDRLNRPAEQILLHHTNAPLCTEIQQRLDARFRNMETDRLYLVEDLWMLSSSRYDRPQGHPFWFLDPELLGTVRRAAQARHGKPTGGPRPKMVYLSRTDATRRRMVNEKELIARLESRGVKPVLMSGLSGTDQLELISQADLVIAPHGGALLNLVAAQSGTRVVELFTPEVGTLAFAAIALACGLDYRFHIGRPAKGGILDNMPWTTNADDVMRLAGLDG